MADKKFSDTPIDATQVDDATDIQFGASNQVNSSAVDATIALSEMQKVGHQDRAITMGLDGEFTMQVEEVVSTNTTTGLPKTKLNVDLTAIGFEGSFPTLVENSVTAKTAAGSFYNGVCYDFRLRSDPTSVYDANNQITCMKLGIDAADQDTNPLNVPHCLEVEALFGRAGYAGAQTAVTGIKVAFSGRASNGCTSCQGIELASTVVSGDIPTGMAALALSAGTLSTGADSYKQGRLAWTGGNAELSAYADGAAGSTASLVIHGNGMYNAASGGAASPTLSALPTGFNTAASAEWIMMYDNTGTRFMIPIWRV